MFCTLLVGALKFTGYIVRIQQNYFYSFKTYKIRTVLKL